MSLKFGFALEVYFAPSVSLAARSKKSSTALGETGAMFESIFIPNLFNFPLVFPSQPLGDNHSNTMLTTCALSWRYPRRLEKDLSNLSVPDSWKVVKTWLRGIASRAFFASLLAIA